MALNTAHANNGVLLHAGEGILLFCNNVTMSFSGGVNVAAFSGGDKHGRLYLTTHRIIFNNKKQTDPLKSFSFPFVALREVELEQPVFGANYISGKVVAQPNGNWEGEAKFKLQFKSGGAIDFGTTMLKAAQIASRHYVQDAPPPYTPPTGPWYEAPPPAYSANPNGYMGWVPPTNVFPDHPAPNTVYMTDAPPPYPGINGHHGYANGAAGGGFQNPSQGQGKEAEANASEFFQTGFYNPSQPGTVFIPPMPEEQPPSYDDATKKNN